MMILFVLFDKIDDEFGEKTVSVLLDGEESDMIFIDHASAEMSVNKSPGRGEMIRLNCTFFPVRPLEDINPSAGCGGKITAESRVVGGREPVQTVADRGDLLIVALLTRLKNNPSRPASQRRNLSWLLGGLVIFQSLPHRITRRVADNNGLPVVPAIIILS